MKKRSKSRELAMQTLYAFEMGTDDDYIRLLETMAERNESSLEVTLYARALVKQVHENKGKTDALLQKHAANWELKRMAAIDRSVLRLAVAELELSDEVPFKVVIDEAVELAKTFGSDESGKFVNGVIDAVQKELSRSKQEKGN